MISKVQKMIHNENLQIADDHHIVNNIIVSILYCVSLSTVVQLYKCTRFSSHTILFYGHHKLYMDDQLTNRTAVPSVSKTNVHHRMSLS